MGCLFETAKCNYSKTKAYQRDRKIIKEQQITIEATHTTLTNANDHNSVNICSCSCNSFAKSTKEIKSIEAKYSVSSTKIVSEPTKEQTIIIDNSTSSSYYTPLSYLNRTNRIRNSSSSSSSSSNSNSFDHNNNNKNNRINSCDCSKQNENNLYLQQRTNRNAIIISNDSQQMEMANDASDSTTTTAATSIQSQNVRTDQDSNAHDWLLLPPSLGNYITTRWILSAYNRLINNFSNYSNQVSSNKGNRTTMTASQHHHHHRHHRIQQQRIHYNCHLRRFKRNCYNNSSFRYPFNLSAVSSLILVLCYLTTTTAATAVTDHPIQENKIDWNLFDESSSDKEILDHLLQKSRYDKRLLPPVNDEDFCCGLSSPDMAKNQTSMRPHNRGTLTVNVNVLLLSLASPDESSLKYEVEFLLNQQWNDPRLQYGNKSQYEYLNALHHHDNIWTPDTYFIMHGDFKDPIIPMHFALRIYRNGTITYAMRRHLILSCQGSLHIFPFDDPKCSFSMESISYEFPQIKYVWKNDEDTLRKSPSLTTLNAYLIQNATVLCSVKSWRGNYSCLKVDLIFTRDRAFYFTTVFIPGIILVTSSFITFWLEWNAVPARSMIGNYSCLKVELMFTRDRAFYFTTVFIPGIILVTSSFITFWLEWNAVPARVMIGVTTMLNFFTTSNGFRSTLPVVSNLTAMNVWDGVCMCFIYASLLEFVCVNYVGRKRPLHNVVYRPGENPVTQRLPAVLSRIGVILASPLEIIEREFHAAMSSEKANLQASGSLPRRVGSLYTRRAGFSGPSGLSTPTSPTEHHYEYHHHHHHHHMRQQQQQQQMQEQIYVEPVYVETAVIEPLSSDSIDPLNPGNNSLSISGMTATLETTTAPYMRQSRVARSMATNTPPLISASGKTHIDIHCNEMVADDGDYNNNNNNTNTGGDMEMMERQIPIKPPRRKSSRSTTPSGINEMNRQDVYNDGGDAANNNNNNNNVGEKKRGDSGGPNEIVACTNCGGGSSPCTHSANNGCATETCFVQVRKKEPPHPIRVAKTIDVIARITFPTAYAIFLIFFFVHYKGFS